MRDDIGKLVGMSAWFALEDLEEACDSLEALEFEAMSVVFTQVASRLIPAPVCLSVAATSPSQIGTPGAPIARAFLTSAESRSVD